MDLNEKFNWGSSANLQSKSFVCGFCGQKVASEKGFSGSSRIAHGGNYHYPAYIYICHYCTRPTYFDYNGEQIPGIVYGNKVENINENIIEEIYQEARRATSANCFTAAVLCCRKLLMHISVSKGAKEGESFAYYVKYLSDNHFVPPGAKVWVDHIRDKGNEANHEIVIMKPEEALELLDFCEMLLKIIFEFPANVQKKYENKDENKETIK